MLTPEDCRTKEQAERVLADAFRNLDELQIQAIKQNPRSTPDDSCQIAYAKKAQRKYLELSEGVHYEQSGFMHYSA